MKEYTTVKGETVHEIVIEKSRFIASVKGVESVEEATEFVNSKRKKFFDATHNCYAYIVDDKIKYSDDGEPQGTAGMPILECIKNNALNRVCVVVTRYFGGIKLGAGGLVRAYNGSCAEALKLCERVQMTDCTRLSVLVDYSQLKPLRRALSAFAREENAVYSDKVELVLLFPSVLSTTITDIVIENTLGKAQFGKSERLLCHFPPLSQNK